MNDKLYRAILFIAAVTIPVVCGGVLFALVTDAHDAFEHLDSSDLSPHRNGAIPKEPNGMALPFITGTLLTTLLALLFCIPFSLPVAFLSENTSKAHGLQLY